MRKLIWCLTLALSLASLNAWGMAHPALGCDENKAKAWLLRSGGIAFGQDDSPLRRGRGRGLVFDRDGTSSFGLAYYLDDAIELRITWRNGDLEVFQNGKRVPEDRLQRDGDTLEILDEDGKSIATIELLDGKIVIPSGSTLRIPRARNLWGGQARVIIGINMGTVDDALAAQLDVERDEVVLITRVLSDYPAEKAGLQKYDVITHINGRSPASAEALREALKDKEPGDVVSLRVLRGGVPLSFEVEAVEYEGGLSFSRPGRNLVFPDRTDQTLRDLRRFNFAPGTPSVPSIPSPLEIPIPRVLSEDRVKELENRLKRVEELLEKLLEKQSRKL